MSAGSTPAGFNISDFFTRIIPGSILTFSIVFPIVGPEFFIGISIQNSVILLFALVSFLVGEVINTTRISMFEVPNHFRRILYTENDGEKEYLGKVDSFISNRYPERVEQYSVFEISNEKVTQTLRERFDLDDDFDGTHDFFKLLISDLSSNKSFETKRLESIYIFYENLSYAVFVSFVFQIIVLVASIFDFINLPEVSTASTLLIAYVLLMIFYFIVFLLDIMAPVDQAYVESLLSDYLTHIKQSD